jgi:hypothetical protein
VTRFAIACCLLLAMAGSALAQYTSSNYSIERWDEDWSYLKDPSTNDDVFDPIKFIPLNDRKDWYLSFGGQLRYRFDYFNNTSFGAGEQDENGWHLFRQLYHVDAHFGPNVRVFLQADSGLAFGRYGGPRGGDIDTVDLQQAFADVTLPLQETSLTLRVGRQELIYGAQRLISPNDWLNVRRTFEGGKLTVAMPDDTLDLFLVRPVLIDKYNLNSGDDHTAFAGIYNVTSFPNLIPDSDAKLDAYLLALDRTRSSTTDVTVDSNTYTLGLRPHLNPGPWDLDLEADWQFGRLGGREINAYSLATEAGYTFANTKFTPRLSLGFDLASGSSNPASRFNQLFPPQYLYLGHMYLFGRENLIDLHPGVRVNLTPSLSLQADEHIFWRQNTNDGVYNLTSEEVRAANGSHARSLGNEFDLAAYWQMDRHTSAYMGWAHFFTGAFLNETGAHSDEDFLYAAVTFTF